MSTQCLSQKPSQELSQAISLLNDLRTALKQNSYNEEAKMVSQHLQQLSTPDYQAYVKERGIAPVLAEFAQVFS